MSTQNTIFEEDIAFKEELDAMEIFYPERHDQEDLIKALQLKAFNNVDFCYDMQEGKFLVVSLNNMKKVYYSSVSGFLMKIQQAYKNTFGEENTFLRFMESTDQGKFVRLLKNELPAVDEFSEFPNIKNGVSDVDGFNVYNHFNHNKKLADLRNKAKHSSKIEKIKDLNWKNYPEIELLFRFLTNEGENEAFDYNSNTGKYDIPVSVFEKLVHYLSALLNRTEKLGVSWTFQSPVQGVGKGVIFDEIIKPIIGSDFVTGINHKTILSGFNGEIDGKLFGVFNECKISKKQDKEVFNSVMKDLITETDIMIHKKNQQQKMKKNFCNIWIFTNEDVPYYLEKNCRRNIVVKTPFCRIEPAVKAHLKQDMDQFIERIRETRDEFYFDLLRFAYDLSFVKLKAPMTEAKREIISKTNTIASVVSEFIKSNDIDELREYLEVNGELSSDKVELICGQTNAGFLTGDSVEILFEMFKGLQAEEMNTTKKNVYFENIFGKQQRINWNEEDGKKKEKRAYRLPHFTTEKVQNYFDNQNNIYEVKDIKPSELAFNIKGFSF